MMWLLQMAYGSVWHLPVDSRSSLTVLFSTKYTLFLIPFRTESRTFTLEVSDNISKQDASDRGFLSRRERPPHALNKRAGVKSPRLCMKWQRGTLAGQQSGLCLHLHYSYRCSCMQSTIDTAAGSCLVSGR